MATKTVLIAGVAALAGAGIAYLALSDGGPGGDGAEAAQADGNDASQGARGAGSFFIEDDQSEPEQHEPAPSESPSAAPTREPAAASTMSARQASCNAGPYLVFFNWDSTSITPEAASVLDAAIQQYHASCHGAPVMLAGHEDRSGSAQYAIGVSQRRADSVSSYLASHGIPASVISSEAYGESRPRVDTADGVREPQNRRVEITFGG